MELKLDNSKVYAIALEGGGARGGYEIGVWQALEEAGIKYRAVAGTSVGALNAGLMTMHSLDTAVEWWSNLKMSTVIKMEPGDEAQLSQMMKGELERSNVREYLEIIRGIIRNKGLDVSPLRELVRTLIDPQVIRESDVDLYVTTLNLTDKKGMEIRVNDLSDEDIPNMLLASAYHPTFRQELLSGKKYADGGFFDTIPIHVLVENGWTDIIAVRLPSIGLERPFIKPANVNLTVIETKSDLGGVLNFDAEQARRDMAIGYLDAKKVLYGLYGEKYYVDRTMTQEEALHYVIAWTAGEKEKENLRRFLEVELPLKNLMTGRLGNGYYSMMIGLLEAKAEAAGAERYRIYTDRELLALTGAL